MSERDQSVREASGRWWAVGRRVARAWLPGVAAAALAWLATGGRAAAAAGGPGVAKVGSLTTSLSGTFETEFNDNVTYSQTDRLADIILRPGIVLGANYPITDYNTLSLDLGASYQQYLIHSSLSSYNTFLSISPDSRLAFKVRIGKAIIVTVYDKFSYEVQPNGAVGFNSATNSTVNSIGQYARFNNEAGVSTVWSMNPLTEMYASAYRYDVFPQESEFSILRRWQYTALAGVRRIITSNLTVGFGATYTANYYEQQFNNNSTSWYLGPSFTWEAIKDWTLTGSVGYVFYSFAAPGFSGNTSSGNVTATGNGDNSQPSTFTGEVSLNNRLTDDLNHGVTFSRTSSYGYVSNTIDVDRVAYELAWTFKPDWVLNFYAYLEEGTNSGGIQDETYHKFAISPGLEHHLNKKTMIYGTYEYTEKDSNIDGRSYYRNRVILGLRYDF